jgi:hypothetical protein
VGDKVFTYLTTNIREKNGITEWNNNFSTFFDIKNPDNTNLGTIGFSIAGISLFDPGLENRRDFSLKRDDPVYVRLEQIERLLRIGREIESDDASYIKSLWESHTQA